LDVATGEVRAGVGNLLAGRSQIEATGAAVSDERTLDRVLLDMLCARMSDSKFHGLLGDHGGWVYEGRPIWNRVAALKCELLLNHMICLRDEKFSLGPPCRHQGPAYEWLRDFTWETCEAGVRTLADEATQAEALP
jgi:hypothetical protein